MPKSNEASSSVVYSSIVRTEAGKALLAERDGIVTRARAAVDKMKPGMNDKDLARMEREHDDMMARIDEIDERLRVEVDTEVRAARRPHFGDHISAPGSDVPPGIGNEEVEITESRALAPNESFEARARARKPESAAEYRGLTTGGLLRAMVVGASNDVERRALSEGSDSAGGYTVPDILAARLIDRMRASSVVMRAGAQTIPLESDVSYIAKLLTDPAPAWRLENAAINESDPTFGRVTFTARSLAVMVKLSRELLEDSLNISTALPNAIAAAMALELDRVALRGTGTAPEPRGVSNFAGLTASGYATLSLASYTPLVRLRTALRTANSDVTAYVMSPRDDGKLAEMTDGEGNPLQVPPAIANVPRLVTTSIPTNLGAGTNESFILAGDWSRLMVGIRNNIRIEILRERYADTHQYAFVAHLRADVAAEHEAAFTKIAAVTVA